MDLKIKALKGKVVNSFFFFRSGACKSIRMAYERLGITFYR